MRENVIGEIWGDAQKMIEEIKTEWRKNKILTGVMFVTLLIAVLNYIKPASTMGILEYLGFSIFNFTILAIILISMWIYFIKKRRR